MVFTLAARGAFSDIKLRSFWGHALLRWDAAGKTPVKLSIELELKQPTHAGLGMRL